MSALVPLAVLGCGVLASGGGTPRGTGAFNEDRVAVGDYGSVLAIAASPRMVFVASETGLAVRDVLSERWLRPLTEAEGYPAGRITGIAADPEQDAVWIIALGEVLYYRPAIDQLIRTMIAGRMAHFFFDRVDPGAGAYVRYGDQWARVSPAGFATPLTYDQLPPFGQRQIPATLETLRDEFPALLSFAGLRTRDEALRSWTITSGARAPGRSEVWLGSAGGGAYVAEPLFNRARPVPYGLFERGASSLALASDGVWVGSLGLDIRGTGGVVAVSADLQEWAWLRGPGDGSMAGLRIHDLAVRNGFVWAATDRGVAARPANAPAGARPTEWEWTIGRDAGRAFALAPARGGVWLGTDRAVILMESPGESTRPPRGGGAVVGLATAAVRALIATGDTLWVGTETGLRRVLTAEGAPHFLDAGAMLPAWLQRPIVALARSDSVIVAATDARVAVIDVRRGTVGLPPGDPDLGGLGRLRSVAIDARTIWVGGDRGAAVIDRATGLMRGVSQPGVLADAVLDIALQPDFAWLATPGGLVRLRRLPDGGAR